MQAIEGFREMLKTELEKRKAARPLYSLRAFARHLGLSPSFLCEIMRGNKVPSPQMVAQVLGRLEAAKRNPGGISAVTAPTTSVSPVGDGAGTTN